MNKHQASHIAILVVSSFELGCWASSSDNSGWYDTSPDPGTTTVESTETTESETAGTETGSETGTETDSETGTETDSETGTETGTDTDSDLVELELTQATLPTSRDLDWSQLAWAAPEATRRSRGWREVPSNVAIVANRDE